MLTEHVLHGGADLGQEVERHISRRTAGRVRGLLVEVRGGRVAVHGVTDTYYVKQLAILAVCEAFGPERRPPVEIDIQVRPA
jgi:hypothetical protein